MSTVRPLARNRPSGPRTTPGRSGSRLWKSSPSSGAMSRTDPESMSLVDTGCTLCVGDVGARLPRQARRRSVGCPPAPGRLTGAHVKRRRIGRRESRTRRSDDVAAGGNVRERHLPGPVGHGFGERRSRRLPTATRRLHRRLHRALEDRDSGRDTARTGDGLLRTSTDFRWTSARRVDTSEGAHTATTIAMIVQQPRGSLEPHLVRKEVMEPLIILPSRIDSGTPA